MQDREKLLNKIKEAYECTDTAKSLSEAIKTLCIQASMSANREALKGVKKYGYLAPQWVKHYLPLEYPTAEAKAKAEKFKNMTAYDIAIYKEAESSKEFKDYGYTRTVNGEKAFKSTGLEAIFKDVAGGVAEYNKLFKYLHKGDTLTIHSIYSDFSTQEQLITLIKFAEANRIILKSKVEKWFNNSTPEGCIMLEGMSKLSEINSHYLTVKNEELNKYERATTKQGQRLKAGADMNRAIELYQQGEKTVKSICEECKVSRSGLWRRLKALGLK